MKIKTFLALAILAGVSCSDCGRKPCAVWLAPETKTLERASLEAAKDVCISTEGTPVRYGECIQDNWVRRKGCWNRLWGIRVMEGLPWSKLVEVLAHEIDHERRQSAEERLE